MEALIFILGGSAVCGFLFLMWMLHTKGGKNGLNNYKILNRGNLKRISPLFFLLTTYFAKSAIWYIR